MHPALRVIAVAFLISQTIACSTGSVTAIWTEAGSVPVPYRDLVVIGVASRATVRRAYEENFVKELKEIGVAARAGYGVNPLREPLPKDAIENFLADTGADGFIVTHLVAESSQNTEPPMRAERVPDVYRQIAPYYSQVYRDIMQPGYYADYQRLRLQTNLYDAKRTTLVWSARSRPLDPRSEETTIRQVIADTLSRMKQDGYLPPHSDGSRQIAQ